jgi:hypothetical protein
MHETISRGLRVTALLAALCAVAVPVAAAVTPDRLFSSALATARAQRSVHYVVTADSPTVNVRMVGDAALDRGRQRITYSTGGLSGHVTVLVVAGTAYVRGDAFALAKYMRFSTTEARRDAGRWLRIPPTAAGFATVSAGVRLTSTLQELTLPKPRVVLPASMLDGQRVVGIRSTSAHRTDTFYVRATRPSLPVADVSRQGQDRVAITFSKWNEPVGIVSPRGATPIP